MELKPTTQDISWFLDQYYRGLLDLNPPYQRNSVWTPKDRRYFLDTVFNGFPSPAIYLHKELKENGSTVWHVVDGKQRLSTIINFANNKIALDKKIGDHRLAGKKWKHLDAEVSLKMKFWNYTFQVQVLPEIEIEWIREVFDRLNRNSKNLERQELRHAKYDGWLISFLESQADLVDWQILRVVTAGRSKRMRHVQFLAELARINIKHEIAGFDQDDLDKLHADYDSLQEDGDEVELDFVEATDKPVDFDEELFMDGFEKCRRYLLRVEEETKAISEYASTYINFYSLWSVIALNEELMDSIQEDEFGRRYADFMAQVKELIIAKTPAESEAGAAESAHSYDYYRGSRGASTELPQRRLRHDALLSVFKQAK